MPQQEAFSFSILYVWSFVRSQGVTSLVLIAVPGMHPSGVCLLEGTCVVHQFLHGDYILCHGGSKIQTIIVDEGSGTDSSKVNTSAFDWTRCPWSCADRVWKNPCICGPSSRAALPWEFYATEWHWCDRHLSHTRACHAGTIEYHHSSGLKSTDSCKVATFLHVALQSRITGK